MSPHTESFQRDPLEQIAESFLARLRAGERPEVSEYEHNHPDLAEDIRELFPALMLMEEGRAGVKEAPAPAPPRAAPEPIPERLGEYRLLREIGRGGMGVVYEAFQESLGRHVALKILPFNPLTQPEHLERFRREARAAARLHHTNIVPVFGVGTDQGLHYYAMQFIHGQGLDAVLQEVRRLRTDRGVIAAPEVTTCLARGMLSDRYPGLGGPTLVAGPAGVPASLISPAAATPAGHEAASPASADISSHITLQGPYYAGIARIGLQAAEALDYAHGQGVIHRDIKPSNLLLDTEGRVWITDFGLAKTEGTGELTESGAILGTVRYMAPERFHNQADARSDVYALGATLYELLTLRPAFEQAPYPRLMQQITTLDPPPPHRLDPRIPRDLETIVQKAMAKEPAQRYASAAALAEDLRRFLSDRPIRARRTPWSERVWRWCRRNPLPACFAVLTFLLLTVVAVSLVLWGSAERQRQWEARENLSHLRHATEAAEEMATAEIRAGRFDSADKIIQGTLQSLHQEPELEAIRSRLQARGERVHCLVRFYTLADEVERLTYHERLRETESAGNQALASLELLSHEDWWTHLPDADLDPSQRDHLRIEAYRQLILMAGIRALEGMKTRNTPDGQGLLRSALDLLARADRYRPSHSGRILKNCCSFALGRFDQLRPQPPGEPTSAVDYYFLGLLHLAIPTTTGHPVAEFIKARSSLLVPGLDFKTPFVSASRHLQTAARLQPEHYFTYLFLADALRLNHQPDAAALAANTCVALQPADSIGYEERASAFSALMAAEKDEAKKKQFFARAIDDATQAIRLRSNSPTAYAVRGNTHRERGQLDEAIRDLSEAIRIFEEEAARAKAAHKTPLGPGLHLPQHYRERGSTYARKGDHAQAIADFSRAIALAPHPDLYFRRANSHRLRGELDEAIADYTTILQRPKNSGAYRRRAEVYSLRRQWAQAAADLARVVQLEPGRANSRQMYGDVLVRAGRLEEYRRAAESMLKAFSGTPDAYDAAAIAVTSSQAALPPELTALALKLAQRAAQKDPTDGWIQYTLALACYRAGKFDKAIDHAEESSRVWPTWEGRHLNWLVLALAHFRQGNNAQARQWLDKAEHWYAQRRAGAPPGTFVWINENWWDWVEFENLQQEASHLRSGRHLTN